MYVDASLVTARRSTDTRRLRSAGCKATRQPAVAAPSAGAGRLRHITAATRRTRLADAIVSQWLLEQVPSDHRHAGRGASARELRA